MAKQNNKKPVVRIIKENVPVKTTIHTPAKQQSNNTPKRGTGPRDSND